MRKQIRDSVSDHMLAYQNDGRARNLHNLGSVKAGADEFINLSPLADELRARLCLHIESRNESNVNKTLNASRNKLNGYFLVFGDKKIYVELNCHDEDNLILFSLRRARALGILTHFSTLMVIEN